MNVRNRYWLALVAIMALVIVVGCSDDDDPVTPPPDPTVTETIGAAGGTLEKDDAFQMVVPAGALAADVEFTGGPTEVPPALPAGLVAVSDYYTIEPSGTDFGQDATLTLHYSEDAIPDFIPEEDLVIYTHDGTEWNDLMGTVDEDANTATADIGHLSDFVVTAPQPEAPDPVYLEFEIGRRYYGSQAKADDGYDYLEVDFRGNYGGKVEDYLYGGEVAYGEWDLQYGMGSYYYSNDDIPRFLTMGSTYDLVIEGSLDVTPLTLPVAVMTDAAIITNIADNEELDLTGFTVQWNGTGLGGMVDISLGSDAGYLDVTVENDGSHTFDQADLAGVATGPGDIFLNWEKDVPVVAEGYLEQSVIELVTSHRIPVTFASGGGGTLMDHLETSTVNQTIPDKPSSGSATPLTDVINMPVTGQVDSVRVYLDITHTWMSDLIVKLTSPDGTQLRVLFIGEGGETDGRMQGWYPDDFTPKDDLNGFDGEAAGGNWTLTAQDYSNGEAGVLNSWRLEIFYTP